MKSILSIFAISAFFFNLFFYQSPATHAQDANTGCMKYSDLQTLMDQNHLELLWRGLEGNNKWLELWTDFSDRHNILVEYENPAFNNAFEIKKACIIASTRDTTYKITSLEKIITWFEKLNTKI